MKPSRALLTFSTLAFTFGWGTEAKADKPIALSFDLEPAIQDDGAELPAAIIAPEAPALPQAKTNTEAPLPIPPGAENPPMSGDTTWPTGVHGGVDAIAVGNGQSVQALLPAPPPTPEPIVQVATALKPVAESSDVSEEIGLFTQEDIDDVIAWSLDLEPLHQPPKKAETTTEQPEETSFVASTRSWDSIQAMFAGGTDSLVARAVGSAEGTRTPEGHKNPAYFGHIDPGNGVWNMGTFSYQHGANTPEEADAKQLKRLQRQTEVLRQKAEAKGLALSQEELLNGIDLANQAPLAALDRGGYLDWLEEAHSLGMSGSDAIVWARTRAFIDPDTRRWNAPGLGNNVYSISHDQERRANAIARAMTATSLVAQTVPLASANESVQPAPQDTTDLAITQSIANPELEGMAKSIGQFHEIPAVEPAIALDFSDNALAWDQVDPQDDQINRIAPTAQISPASSQVLPETGVAQPSDPKTVQLAADTLVLKEADVPSSEIMETEAEVPNLENVSDMDQPLPADTAAEASETSSKTSASEEATSKVLPSNDSVDTTDTTVTNSVAITAATIEPHSLKAPSTGHSRTSPQAAPPSTLPFSAPNVFKPTQAHRESETETLPEPRTATALTPYQNVTDALNQALESLTDRQKALSEER